MREDQADQIVELLSEMLTELREMKGQLDEFTGYNVFKMETLVGDLNDRLGEVTNAISSLETTVDLK